MKEERNRVYIRSCKMVLWPIRARVPFELFYNVIFTTIGSNVTISLANLPLSNTDNTDHCEDEYLCR